MNGQYLIENSQWAKKSVNMKNMTNPCIIPNSRLQSQYSRNQMYQFASEFTH